MHVNWTESCLLVQSVQARTPHANHTAPAATTAPDADEAARHPPRAQQDPAQRT